MIRRSIEPQLQSLARTFPVVTLEGPRQSGKTTLARAAFPDWSYANLEDSATRSLAQRDPAAFFARFPCPAIVDEVQRVPELLGAIQVAVDRDGGNGRFLLTGSHQPRLKQGIAQTLAGRTALLTLLPFSIEELASAGIRPGRDELIHTGFLPAIYDRNQPPAAAWEAYYRTYVERDVRDLVRLAHQPQFELFLRLLAGRVGGLLNLDTMSGEVGISATTLKQWMSVLEAGFVIFRLFPHANNFGKRFVKTPKIYFTDVGLAAHLLGIETAEQAERDPLAGGLFENLVVVEALKARLNAGKAPNLWFFRDKAGREIDLVLDVRRKLRLYEIKRARTPDESLAGNLRKFRQLAGEAVASADVVYAGEPWPIPGGGRFLPFRDLAADVRQADASDSLPVAPASPLASR